MSSFNGFKEVVADKLDTLDFNPYKKIGKEWFLVTAGDESGWNTMTASWGFAGVMWGKEHLHHSYKTTEIYKGIYRQGRIFHHKLFQRGL